MDADFPSAGRPSKVAELGSGETGVTHRSIIGVFAAAALGALATGCASSDPNSEDYDPTLTAVSQTLSPTATRPAAPFVAAGAERGGNFPTFLPEPRRATAQMSEAEREMIAAEMAMLKAERDNDMVAATNYREKLVELRRLAREHGPETRRRIEN